MLHATNATTLTRWKGEEERSWSAHATCDECDDTYALEGEEEHSLSVQAACDECDGTYGLEGEGEVQFGKGEHSLSAHAACDEGDDTYGLKGKGERSSSVQAASDECYDTYFLEGKGGAQCGKGEHSLSVHAECDGTYGLEGEGGAQLGKEERSSSAYAACDEGDDTYFLEGEGGAQFVSLHCMRRRQQPLRTGRGRGSTVCQRGLHATNATTLTSWKGEEERSWLAHAACDEGDDTYGLKGEGGAQLGKGSAVRQRRRQAMKATTLTRWKGKGERSSLAQVASSAGDDTYTLEEEGGAHFVSARGEGGAQFGKAERNSSAQAACDECDDTYELEGEEERSSSDHAACDECDDTYALEGEALEGEEERSLSAYAACDEGDDTYALEGGAQFIGAGGGAQFMSAGGKRRMLQHLLPGRGKVTAVGQRTLHAMKATTLTSWKGKRERGSSAQAASDEYYDTYALEEGAQLMSAGGKRRMLQHLLPGRGRGSAVGQRTLHATKATTLTSWKGKGERSLSAQAASDECYNTYELERKWGAQFVSARGMHEGDDTYALEGEGGAQLGEEERGLSVHTACAECDDTYGLEWEGGAQLGKGDRSWGRGSAVCQRTLHATKATTLTVWEGNGERSLSAYAACAESDNTYELEGEGGAPFGKGGRTSSAYAAYDEGDDTYFLEGEGGAQFGKEERSLGRRSAVRQPTLHATKATTLTSWKGKEERSLGRRSAVRQPTLHATKATTLTNWKGEGERSSSAQAASDEGDDTYALEGEGGAQFFSAGGKQRRP
ncbi:hypothetical protein C8J57DRAFT_1581311 [Mycena rebaudengoi]|nr:hypothetical protein C8J57DRAFT_1581311 [Mycena rebaudengoi]